MKEKFKIFLTKKGITEEVYTEKTGEEKATLFMEFNEELNKEIETLIADKADKSDIQKAMDTMRDAQLEQAKTLNETLKEFGLSIKAFTEGKNPLKANKKTLKEMLIDALPKLKIQKEGKRSEAEENRVSFEVDKAVGTMTSANISGGNVPVEQRLAGLDTIASRKIRLLDLVSRGSALSNTISWVSQANKEGAAGQTGEGLVKNQIDFDLVVVADALKKTTAFIKISTEMLEDVDFIESEINNELDREIMKKIEAGIYSGSGVGINLNGIRTVAPAFVAGSFALAVSNANQMDVLTVAMNQIAIAEQDEATAIFMHPTDVTKIMLLKVSTTDRRYLDRLVTINGQLYLDGTPIVKSTLVTVGEYLIGNFLDATVYDKGDVRYDIGLDGNDFTLNLRTILGEWRGLCIVKTNRRTSFVKGVFATDIAAILLP